jgi:hypothetical protein
MNIEHDLQRALRRKPAPPDLADRVLARVANERTTSNPQGTPPRRSGRQGPLLHVRWLAAAAAVVLVASGGARYYATQQEAAEAERVKQEVRIALQITSEVFSRAQQRILDANERR